MEILIVGAGARGSYLGARLIESGHNVAFLTGPRRRATLMTRHLLVNSPFGRFHQPVFTPLPEHLKQPVKLIVLTCRAHLWQDALVQAKAAIGPKTLILTLVEGVSHLQQIAADFPDHQGRLLGGVFEVRASMDADAMVYHRAPVARLRIGAIKPSVTSSKLVDTIVRMLQGRGLITERTDCVLSDAWARLAYLGAGIAASAQFDLPLRDVLRQYNKRAVHDDMRQEAACVAYATGVPISRAVAERYKQAMFMESEPLMAPPMITDAGGAGAEALFLLRELLAHARTCGAETRCLDRAMAKIDGRIEPVIDREFED